MRAMLRVAGLVLLSACGGAAPLTTWPGGPGAAVIEQRYAFPDVPEAVAPPLAPPLGLTASDGTGLRLVDLEARAIVEDPLAFTELHLTFDNPEARVLEGTFSITLPEGAALSRFAMKLDDGWQEAEVVEKKAAREAYEDFLHRKQDPALLEQAAGNQFTARVFPIPARGRKQIIVSYSEELSRGRAWSLPLRGLPEIGRIDASVTLAGQAEPIARLGRQNVKPEADFSLDPRFVAQGAGLRSDNLVLARVRPLPDAAPDPLGPTMVLVDTSASRALGFDEELRLVDALVRRIAATSGEKTKVLVACFDQTTDAVFEAEAGAWSAADRKRARSRQAFGASDLGRALAFAEERALARGYRRVVIVGDGVTTAGDTSAAGIAARAAKLGSAGVERLDVVAVGGLRDDIMLRKLVTAGLPRDGVVAEAASGAEAIMGRLATMTRSAIPVRIEGARWVWPSELNGVQPGDEVLVYADVPEGQEVRVRVGDRTSAALDLERVARPLLDRAFAKARIASMIELAGPEPAPALVREIVGASTKHRVLSPYTALLVLETDQDYARFSIDRKALADILVVDGGRVAVGARRQPSASRANVDARVAARERKDAAPQVSPPRRIAAGEPMEQARAATPPAPSASAAPSAPRRPRALGAAAPSDPLAARGSMWGAATGDAFGSGGLGLSGVGEGGGGRAEGIGLGNVGTVGRGAGAASGSVSGGRVGGSGQGLGSGHGRASAAHRPAAPRLSMGSATVSGSLDREVIHRGIRPIIPSMRRCYEVALSRDPNLGGRVSVRFRIISDGSVDQVDVSAAGQTDATMLTCIEAAIRSAKFPPPTGGTILITYPFVFSPADDREVQMPPVEARPEHPREITREPYTGRFKSVMDAITAGGAKAAIEGAFAWHHESPGDVMALVALGEALEALGEPQSAARVYGSIIDLFPARADLRRFAGGRLERLPGASALALAADTFSRAAEERADHPSSHRMLAFAQLKKGDHPGAFAAMANGLAQRYPSDRFRGVRQILREDLGLIASAWMRAEPARRDEIAAKLRDAGGSVEDAPSLRFVLSWETDANDVDFHIVDADGSRAYYKSPELASGGRLYADVTTGYGPECFTIRLPREQRSESYKLSAHYYARGPMGYGMGKLEIIDHDGKGGLTFEERPFVVMADRAYVDLGTVRR